MFFVNVKTIDELRNQYRKLAFQLHPDMGGSKKEMQNLNNEFDSLLKKLSDSNEKINIEFEGNLKEVIERLVVLEGLEIELCGSWLWISGNTKEHKETLKSVGCRWASKKKKWYFRNEENKRKFRGKSLAMEQIRYMYGSEKISGQQQAMIR